MAPYLILINRGVGTVFLAKVRSLSIHQKNSYIKKPHLIRCGFRIKGSLYHFRVTVILTVNTKYLNRKLSLLATLIFDR